MPTGDGGAGGRYPVVRFSFGGGVIQSRGELERRIQALLHKSPDGPRGALPRPRGHLVVVD
jgi:hypothetical protein